MVRVRVLAAGLVLLGAGCAVLGWGFRSRQTAANAAAHLPAIEARATAIPSLLATSDAESLGAGGVAQKRARALFAGLPLIFEPNQGQGNLDPADQRAKFVSRGAGYSLFLGSEGAILSLMSREPSKSKQGGASATRVDSLQMKLAGANPKANVTGADLLPGKSNYFLGNDPAKWHRGVPQFARVRYGDVYPGINLVFYGNQGHVEYDFQVAPGSDPKQAQLEFNGAKQLELKDGALVIRSEGGSVQLDAPRVYQEIAGRQQPVEGRFELRGPNRAGFAIGTYDHSRELIIDPILTFSTYFGGSGDEKATSVAVDGSFNVYITGSTTSPNLPTVAGVFQPALATGATKNVYVAKITPPLGAIVAALDYVTYLGGSGSDYPVGISVNGAGEAYLAGTTTSGNFPTTLNGYQNAPEPGSVGTSHAFVTWLDSTATTLKYSSYLSGNNTDIASGMTLDASGFIYVTGTTLSTDTSSGLIQFPASNLPQGVPFQSISRSPGQFQFFVTKVNTSAPKQQSIAYSTYFGGASFFTSPNAIAVGGGIAVDTSGNVYFTGTTNYVFTGCPGCGGSDFPILNAYQPCLDMPPATTITNPQSCTYIANPTEPDAFVAKLNLNPTAAQGLQLVWSTYLGGAGTDSGMGIALDTGAANVYVVGTTNSSPFSQVTTLNTTAAYQECLDTPINPPIGTSCPTLTATPPNDAFVARLTNPTTTTGTAVNVALNYFSYLGGSQNEAGLAISVDSGAGAVVTGWTQSPDFPVFPLGTSSLTGFQDAFTARLNTTAALGQATSGSWVNYFGGSSADSNTVFTEGTGVALDVNQNAYFAGDTNSVDLQVNKPLQATNNGGYDAFVTQLGSALSLSINGVLTSGTNQFYVDAGTQATFTYTVTNNGPDLASNITVVDNLSQAVTQVPLTLVSASVSSGTCGTASTTGGVSCFLPPLQSGSTATVTIVVVPTASSSGSPQSFNGGSVQAIGPGNIVLAQTSVPAAAMDFSISVSPPNGSVLAAGDTAVYQVQLNPHTAYSSGISLGCSGLPAATTCNFTTQSVKLVGGPGSSTLNVVTTARPVVTPAIGIRSLYGLWLAVPGLTLLGAGVGGDKRRRRILGILMLCALFTLLLLQPACGGTSTQAPVSGTPPGIYTITVTGTSGTDSKSGSVTLSVP